MTKRATGTKAAHLRSRLSKEKKGVFQFVAKLRHRLDQADGLWRYWTTHDITENEDDWAAFSDAVRDHLRGEAVPKRFLTQAPEKKTPAKLTGGTDALETLIDKARVLAKAWREDGGGVDANALVDLVYAVEAFDAVREPTSGRQAASDSQGG